MLRRVIAALALAMLPTAGALATAPAGDAGTWEAQLELADRYFRTAERAPARSVTRRENYRKAETLAADILASKPDCASAHFLVFAARGRRLLDDNGVPSVSSIWKYSELHEHLAKALELDPHHANALAARGGILLDLPRLLGGDKETGRKMLERAIELNPSGLGTRVTLARALLEEGDYQSAREHLLLAAHYACLKREAAALRQAEKLLSEVDSGAI